MMIQAKEKVNTVKIFWKHPVNGPKLGQYRLLYIISQQCKIQVYSYDKSIALSATE